jgi:hypothetical protein
MIRIAIVAAMLCGPSCGASTPTAKQETDLAAQLAKERKEEDRCIDSATTRAEADQCLARLRAARAGEGGAP